MDFNQIAVVDTNPTVTFTTPDNPGTMFGTFGAAFSFSAVNIVAGGCTETYTLTGQFTSQNTFSAQLDAQYVGVDCVIGGCFDQSFGFTGTR